ncbi:MAG: hypothetical protein K0B06_02775 [Brevefilum sp.]|nr:hypothetical protein [Brevefilum sp.]
MPVLICPECGAENLPDAETCVVCQNSLLGVEPADLEQHQPDAQFEHVPVDQPEDDLSDLLSSLKQDDALDDFSEEEEGHRSTLSVGEVEQQQDSLEEPEVPEWLHRIRQRAQAEPDSVGDITQRIKAAQESLDEQKKEAQEQRLESVIKKIHGEDDEQPPAEIAGDEEQPVEDDEDVTDDVDWLTRIRKKHRPELAEEVQESLSEREGDSLLQWLVALEEGSSELDGAEDERLHMSELTEDTQEVEISPLPGDSTQEIDIREASSKKRIETEIRVTREEQTRADQLAAIIIDEKTPRPLREPRNGISPSGIRRVLGLMLVILLSFMLFFQSSGSVTSGLQEPQGVAVHAWAEGLPAQAHLLFVLDYQAGYAPEIALVAQPLLELIDGESRVISILSSSPSGSLLFSKLLDQTLEVGLLEVHDLGYYPVEAFGAYGLANQVRSKWQITSQPEFMKRLPSGPFDGILILADDYDGASAWIEQLTSLALETPIYLLVTAQAAPLLMPYWESGQVKGILGGMTDAINTDGETAALASRWRAYQAGVLMVIVLLLVGLLFPVQQLQDGEGGGR